MATNTAEEVSTAIKDVFDGLTLSGNPEIILRSRVPGFGDGTTEDTLQRGIYLATMGPEPGRTFSSRQDMRFGTYVVFCEGRSTTQPEIGERDVPSWVRSTIDTFHNRRTTSLDCELFTQVENPPLRMVARLKRKYDAVALRIWSYFRESRP